jgi:hypothetical protein
MGNLAALVAAAGVAIYVLGLVGLAVPIYRKRTRDLSTAWYAASMIPRTVVAGHGVRIWLQWPTLLTPAVLLVLAAVQSVYGQVPDRVTTLIVITLAILMISPAYWSQPASLRTHLGMVIVSTVTAGIAGGALFLTEARLSDAILSGSGIPPYLVDASALARAAVFGFIATFVMQTYAAMNADPRLPAVRIVRQSTRADVDTVEGTLIAHNDGVWHLFDEHNELLSIPDDRVLEARTGGKPRAPAA